MRQYITPSSRLDQATNRMQYRPSRRLLDERQWSGLRVEDITGSTYGQDRLRPAGLFDAFAHPADMHVDQVGARVEVVAPDFLEQHGAGDHLAGIADQEFQQLELGRPQVDLLAATAYRAAHQVQFQVAGAQHLVAGSGLALAPDQ